jgi:hypothetical protein
VIILAILDASVFSFLKPLNIPGKPMHMPIHYRWKCLWTDQARLLFMQEPNRITMHQSLLVKKPGHISIWYGR